VIVYDALVGELRARGLPVIEQPQAAQNTGPNLELWLEGFTLGGEKGNGRAYEYETLAVKADVTASGVARGFVSGLRGILRKMLVFGEDGFAFPVAAQGKNGSTVIHTVTARFEKIAAGSFEYEAEEAPMPARFRESWRIIITYRTNIFAMEEDL
jgi:hypothetical protein